MARRDVRTRRWTRIEYDRLIEDGFLRPGDPVELLGGQLVVAEPQGSRHFATLRVTQDALHAAFGAGWEIRGQGPIALDEKSEPEPDLAVVLARAGLPDYWIVNLPDHALEVYRDPEPDPGAPFGWRYRPASIMGPGTSVTPLARPDGHVRIIDLVP